MKNDLSYIMNQTGQFSDEDNVDGKELIDKDFHYFKKRVKPFYFELDSAKGYYSGRIGVNMYQATISEYTVAFELFWETNNIDKNTVSVNAKSSIKIVSKITANHFDKNTRTIVHMIQSSSQLFNV